jgi:hypothetical protein
MPRLGAFRKYAHHRLIVTTASGVDTMTGLSPYRGSPDTRPVSPIWGRIGVAYWPPKGEAHRRGDVLHEDSQADRYSSRLSARAGSCGRRSLQALVAPTREQTS